MSNTIITAGWTIVSDEETGINSFLCITKKVGLKYIHIHVYENGTVEGAKKA